MASEETKAIGLTKLIVPLLEVYKKLFTISRRIVHNLRKVAPYESGMRPCGDAIRRIPVKFYRVAVLFILFDIEVIFFLPWAVVFRDLRMYGLGVMGVFFFILTVGFVYEWKVGGLEWE